MGKVWIDGGAMLKNLRILKNIITRGSNVLYKKINITTALLGNIEQEAAEAFIDMRLSIKKPLTQRAFNQNMDKAFKCELMGLCDATEAVDIASDKCWLGITPAYVQAHKAREFDAASESTRTSSIDQDLNDRAWAH